MRIYDDFPNPPNILTESFPQSQGLLLIKIQGCSLPYIQIALEGLEGLSGVWYASEKADAFGD